MTRFRTIDGFLTGKMGWNRKPSRHIQYKLPIGLSKALPLTLAVHLQHGKGDVSPHIVKQICSVFGIPQATLDSAFKCNYGNTTLYTSMLVAQMEKLVTQATSDPIVAGALLETYCSSVKQLLNEIQRVCAAGKCHRNDPELVSILIARVSSIRNHSRLTVLSASTFKTLGVALMELEYFIIERDATWNRGK